MIIFIKKQPPALDDVQKTYDIWTSEQDSPYEEAASAFSKVLFRAARESSDFHLSFFFPTRICMSDLSQIHSILMEWYPVIGFSF